MSPTAHIERRHRPVAGPPRFRRLRVLFALLVREMGSRFGKSAGGYIWAIAEPLGGIVLLAVVFSLAIRTPPLGASFLLFYATGTLPFNMFNNIAKEAGGAITSNKGLLTYPVVTVLDAIFARFVLNLLTLLVVAVILFAGIIIVAEPHLSLDPAAAVLAMGLAALLGLGVGTLNCVLFGFFPTWRNVWTVLTRPLFILSGILYTPENVPEAFRAALLWNPLVHVVGVMRTGFYGTYEPQYVSYPYVLGLALGLFAIGAYLLRRHTSTLITK